MIKKSCPLTSVNIQIFLLLKGWNHLQDIKDKGWNHLQDVKDPKDDFNNDYIYQNASTICCEHNIHSMIGEMTCVWLKSSKNF